MEYIILDMKTAHLGNVIQIVLFVFHSVNHYSGHVRSLIVPAAVCLFILTNRHFYEFFCMREILFR